MGGCASKPKEFDIRPESLPAEAPETTIKAEGEAVEPEKENGGETQKEEPLVDLSEPKPEAGEASSESKTGDAEVVTKEISNPPTAVTATPTTEEAAEKEKKPSEDKEPEAGKETTKPAAAKEAAVEAAATVKTTTTTDATTPSSEDKSDAPLFTV